jgi:hypothetical protein
MKETPPGEANSRPTNQDISPFYSTGSYTAPDTSSPHPATTLFQDQFIYYPPIYSCLSLIVSSLRVSSKSLCAFLIYSTRAIFPDHVILLVLIILVLAEDSYCAMLWSLLLFPRCLLQIFFEFPDHIHPLSVFSIVVRDQVSPTNITTDMIIVLVFLSSY